MLLLIIIMNFSYLTDHPEVCNLFFNQDGSIKFQTVQFNVKHTHTNNTILKPVTSV